MPLLVPSGVLVPETEARASASAARPKAKPPKQDVPSTQWLGGAFVSVPLVLLHLLIGALRASDLVYVLWSSNQQCWWVRLEALVLQRSHAPH